MSKAMDEFFDFLKLTPRTWQYVDGGDEWNRQIRNGPIFKGLNSRETRYCWPLCPLTAVASYKSGQLRAVGSADWKESAEHLGLTPEEAALVSQAADADPEKGYDSEIRARLLEATGLA